MLLQRELRWAAQNSGGATSMALRWRKIVAGNSSLYNFALRYVTWSSHKESRKTFL